MVTTEHTSTSIYPVAQILQTKIQEKRKKYRLHYHQPFPVDMRVWLCRTKNDHCESSCTQSLLNAGVVLPQGQNVSVDHTRIKLRPYKSTGSSTRSEKHNMLTEYQSCFHTNFGVYHEIYGFLALFVGSL